MKVLNVIKSMLLLASINVLTIGSANAYIVNIGAHDHGIPNPVQLELYPGTFDIIVVGGNYDAWTAWDLSKDHIGKDLCLDPNGCNTGDDYIGWLNSFSISSPDLENVLINGSSALPTSGDRYDVNQHLVYADAVTALEHAWSARITVTKSGLVNFMVPDMSTHDNVGGISLHVIPEPSIIALMALGLIGFGFTSRKKS